MRDVLIDTSVSVSGRRIGGDLKKGLVLLRVDGPLRAGHLTTGIDYPDLWAGHAAMYREFSCRGGSLSVRLGSDARLFKSSQLVEAYVRGRFAASALVGPYREATLVVPLRPRPARLVHRPVPDPADARSRARASRRAPTRADSAIRFLDFTVS